MREHALYDQERCRSLCFACAPRHVAGLEVFSERVGALLLERALCLKTVKLPRVDLRFPHPLRRCRRRWSETIEKQGDADEDEYPEDEYEGAHARLGVVFKGST